MKNYEIYQINEALGELKQIAKKDLAYVVYKNLQKLSEEMEIIEKMKYQPSEKYLEYDGKRNTVCISYADKDEVTKEPLVVPGTQPGEPGKYQIPESKQEKFITELQSLQEEYTDSLEDKKKQEQDFIDFLNADSQLELLNINKDILPEYITADFLMKISSILED